jgi:hypothetical protein
MTTQERDALESARHELTTLHGLHAFDGEAPKETFVIDTSECIRKLDAVLGEPSESEGQRS